MPLERIGLTKYVREGCPLPPLKWVKAYQMAVKNMCDHSKHSDGKFSSKGEQKIHEASYCYNESTRQVVKYSYIDWLVIKLRPIRKSYIPQYSLHTDYIDSKSF